MNLLILVAMVLGFWVLCWFSAGGATRRSVPTAVETELEAIPEHLKGAEVVMNEGWLRTNVPVPLHGKGDQVLKTTDGLLVPIDTKTRKHIRVKDSDIIQLGVYATILRNTRKEPVADIGYIRVVTPDGAVKYLPIILPTDDQIVQLYQTRSDLKTGRSTNVILKREECFFCQYKKTCSNAK